MKKILLPGTKLYLAGPMAGLEDHNFPAFNVAAEKLRLAGFEVLNPVEFDNTGCLEWADFLKRDIPYLLQCKAVAVLDGWWNSRGAKLETHIAAELGMPIYPVQMVLAFTYKSLNCLRCEGLKNSPPKV